MQAITVRLANLQDREALCQLYHEFHEFHVRGVPDRLLSPSQPPATYLGSELYLTLEKIIAADDAAIWVAEVAGQLVGLAEVYVRDDEPGPLRVARRYGHLQSLMVQAACQRRGIGAQLLAAAQQWAAANGAVEMRLDTWEFAAGPLAFYQSLGYRTLRRTWVREL